MREIKFRGQSNSTGKWYFGYYIKSDNGPEGIDHVIQFTGGYKDDIDPDTVGQFTGLKDKNGKEIYESDLFRDNDGFIWKVFFEDGKFIAKGGEWDLTETLIEFTPEHCEVIGNVFENEDLLEG
jgi:uncharacterized phage protein (TIGR01671 family)